MRSASLDALRLENPELIDSASARRILLFLQRVGMLPFVKLAVAANFNNPFKAAVTVLAEKRRPA
jgi:hypothetical protein